VLTLYLSDGVRPLWQGEARERFAVDDYWNDKKAVISRFRGLPVCTPAIRPLCRFSIKIERKVVGLKEGLFFGCYLR